MSESDLLERLGRYAEKLEKLANPNMLSERNDAIRDFREGALTRKQLDEYMVSITAKRDAHRVDLNLFYKTVPELGEEVRENE